MNRLTQAISALAKAQAEEVLWHSDAMTGKRILGQQHELRRAVQFAEREVQYHLGQLLRK